VVADRTDHHKMFRLSYGGTNQDYTDIDYALEMASGGTLKIYEKGTYMGSFGSYSVGDVLRVAVESGTVKYYRNSTLLYTSGVSPTYPLRIDTSIYTPGAWIKYAYVCSTTLISTTTILYIGGLYEEELNGTNTPPYISYYQFGGKLVGMRRMNQVSGNGQYRIAGDHLGSSTLVLDTSSPPQVVSRQYHKPYGEVAWQGGGTPMQGLTSIGYTGQRLDTDSGLMFYNARMYDPSLAHFVSADTIAPGSDPQMRNRYGYVVNNPLRYTDPSGHSPAEGEKTTEDAATARRELERHGIVVDDPQNWTLEELEALLEGIRRMMSAMGWRSIHDFRWAMGIDDLGPIYLMKGRPEGRTNTQTYPEGEERGYDRGGEYFGWTDDKSPWKGKNNRPDRRGIRITEWERTPQELARIFVHELAHAWDEASGGCSGPGGPCNMSQGMDRRTGGGKRSGAATTRGQENATEDWAEAVTAYVYPELPRYGYFDGSRYRYNSMDPKRVSWVEQQRAAKSSRSTPLYGPR
jgi:RHS repeat-associated protein